MKKIPIFFLIILISTALFSDTYNSEQKWGLKISELRNSLPEKSKTYEFSPKTEPKYKNKILNYILAIDQGTIEKIKILRVKANPQTDFLFINSSLYSIMEDWKKIDTGLVSKIKSDLEGKFGKPSLQQDSNKYIYSFNKDRTKVLLYVLKLPGHVSKCKVYYYTKNLFKMLMFQ